jgi:hypothetical protein
MDASTPATISPDAIRAKRYRDRRKDGIRCVRIRVSEAALKALVDGGWLPAGPNSDGDIERAFYGLLNAAHRARVTRNG